MSITIQEVIDNELLDDDIIDCIPHECEECGSEIEFTDTLKQIYCPNRMCALKVAARLEALAKKMKVDGWGYSTCLAVVRYFNLKSPYQVFLLNEYHECPDVAAFKKKVAAITDSSKRRVKLWECVTLAGIPSIDTIAYKIFDGYKNLDEAYKDIEKYQVPFIAEKLGIKNSDTGVMAVRVYNTLIEYKNELLFGESKFNIYEAEGEKLKIAITGGVYGYKNKSEFISYINSRYNGIINATLMNTVTAQLDILIADGDTSSNKFVKANKLNESGKANILITDSLGLIKYLDEKYLTPKT